MPKFVPRERKHKRLERQKQIVQNQGPDHVADSHAQLPLSATQQRRRQLHDEARSQQPDQKISGKKRKRLDKYIETKLKKEENLELLKKLAAHKVDTSLLQSAKKLGRRNETKRERFQRALSERNAGIDVDGQQDSILFERRVEPVQAVSESESDDDNEEQDTVTVQSIDTQNPPTSGPASFGSGLKRPLEVDDAGKPIIKKRKRNKPRAKARGFLVPRHESIEVSAEGSSGEDHDLTEEDDFDEDEWNGFGSNEGSERSQEDEDKDEESEASSGSEDESDLQDGSESESAASSDSDNEDQPSENRSERTSAFKAWANSQRNEALGFTPSTVPTNDVSIKAAFKPRAASPDPELRELNLVTSGSNNYRPTDSVLVTRPDEVQAARLELPVVKEEQKIMEAVHNNSITVVCGATGSGKTTQVPQMLFENGYATKGMIGITQPRRVAAVSVANRVMFELGDDFGKQVAHQVRYDSNVRRDTNIKFMTDGILLREISHDFVLSKYSVIVIDEAHERSVNTDILIGMLSRIVPLRDELSRENPEKHHPLKLLIMSATLRVTDFVLNNRLFPTTKPPIVEAEGRQFNVTEHFARRTHRDYVDETVNKVVRGHRKLPPGAFLVFLTGQDEIHTVAQRLKEKFADDVTGFRSLKKSVAKSRQSSRYIEDEGHDDSDSEAEITGLDDVEDDDAEFVVEEDHQSPRRPGSLRAHVLPLYASLPSEQQLLVFKPPPNDARLIILSTNVAETSLTIPGVRFVFDCGRSKEKTYDTSTGVQEFKVDWISKASASQRMGRAGRTGPGHCYRLYSSAIYEQFFQEHTEPELLRTPIENTVLQLKNMEVDNVVNFPFPTPPKSEQLLRALQLLSNLGAIDGSSGKITPVGKQMLRYPVNPRFGKMLLLGARNNVLNHTVALVAGLAVGDLFIPEPQLLSRMTQDKNTQDDASEASDDDRGARDSIDNALLTAAQKRRQAYGRAHATLAAWDDASDALKILTAVAAHAQTEPSDRHSFCAEYFLREKGFAEVEQLRQQLHNIVSSNVIEKGESASAKFTNTLPPPSSKQIGILKQIVVAGYIDQVAIRTDLLPSPPPGLRPPRRAIDVAYRSLLPAMDEDAIDRTASAAEQEQQKCVYVHPSSVLARLTISEMPSYIIYSDLSRAGAATVGGPKEKRVRMRPLASVAQTTLAALAEDSPLLQFGKPIGKIEELDGAIKRRQCWVSVVMRDPKGSEGLQGWQLGAWKVIQARKGKDWVNEKVVARGGRA